MPKISKTGTSSIYIFIFSIVYFNLYSQVNNNTLDTTFADNGQYLYQASNTDNVALIGCMQKNNGSFLCLWSDKNGWYFEQLLSNGKPDLLFGSNGRLKISKPINGTCCYEMMMSKAENITVVGQDKDLTSTGITRFLNNGVPDKNFGSNGYLNNIFAQFLNGEVLSIKVTGNEKTFIVGLIAYDTTLNHNVQIGKLNSNGSLDSSFGKNGYYSEKNDSSTTFLKDIDLDNNGKIIASGSYNDTLFNSFQIIKRLLPDGSLDSSFGKNGVLLIPKELLTVILGHKTLLNGKILTYNLNNYDSYVNRYNNNGTLDSTFADKGQLIIPNLSQNSSSRSRTYFLVQNDNKILVFGENQTDNQLEVHRFTPNGQIDKTYGKNGKNTLKLGNAYLTNSNMMLDEQGRVIISGSGVGKVTSTSPPTSQFFLARFKADKNSINTKEYSAPLPIKIYPNPGNDLLNIETNIELTEATIDFYDLLGKRVFTSSLKTNEKTIDTHLWKSGVYFYQISSQRKIVSSGKWIKM